MMMVTGSRQAVKRYRLSVAALALAVAAVASGCGGSSTSSSSSTQQSAAATAATTGTTAPTPTKEAKQSTQGKAPAKGGGTSTGSASPPPSKQKAAPSKLAKLPVVDMMLATPGLKTTAGSSTLSSANTCAGADTPPLLTWTAVPAGTRELTVFVMNLTPVNGQLFFDWAVTGIPPATKHIGGGPLPAGAVVGRNSAGREGYSICPAKGSRERYVFAVYASTQPLGLSPGFDPKSARRSAVEASRHGGLLLAEYTR